MWWIVPDRLGGSGGSSLYNVKENLKNMNGCLSTTEQRLTPPFPAQPFQILYPDADFCILGRERKILDGQVRPR